ncbi:TOBE domain-containing protein [Streptomyces ferrugineus]|uniref:TOBE domain-containing protein n=1 Tax=Streptomyces ferrugineus TaxID=1413221 RepID=A0A7M2SW46_9ACTN|nr:TOBE domain-containing protein [Streptomyces ferrugineus]QOV39743.1 TOBE domain-containing protein [Streptomyces ferrugineus]
MSLSIRNQLPGTITAITPGEAMAMVDVHLTGGQDLTAAVAPSAVEELGLAEGTAVNALVTATHIALATAPAKDLPLHNRLPGTVTGIATGGAMASVNIEVEGGALTAAVTRDATTDLALSPGVPVVALIEATEVALTTA